MQQQRPPVEQLSPADYRQFFIRHLHRLYCAKAQLIDKLPELSKRSHYLDLKQSIEETVETARLHVRRMQDIYNKLGSHYRSESCIGVLGVLDEAFQSIGMPGENDNLHDLSLLFYMQHIENIEMASFKIMLKVANKLEEPAIGQLLRECYEDTKEEKTLFKQLMSHYL